MCKYAIGSRTGKSQSKPDLDVIDPDHVSAVQGDSITTPNILRVEIRNVHILDDDIVGTADDFQAFPFDDSRATRSDKRLVRLDSDWSDGGVVVIDRH